MYWNTLVHSPSMLEVKMPRYYTIAVAVIIWSCGPLFECIYRESLALITFAYSVVFWLQDQMARKCCALNWVIHVPGKQYECVSVWACMESDRY